MDLLFSMMRFLFTEKPADIETSCSFLYAWTTTNKIIQVRFYIQ